jgi:hypothetical protein
MPAKVESTASLPGLSPAAGKPIVARFDGGCLSSDGGLLALREIEQRLGSASPPTWQAASPTRVCRGRSPTRSRRSSASAC